MKTPTREDDERHLDWMWLREVEKKTASEIAAIWQGYSRNSIIGALHRISVAEEKYNREDQEAGT